MKAITQQRKAREKRLGSVDFVGDNLHFFVGYTKCEHCTQRIKILVTGDEARDISKTFGYYRPGLKARLAIKLQKWASSV